MQAASRLFKRQGPMLHWGDIAAWGVGNDIPVVHIHGTPSSYMERYPDQTELDKNGIRFLVAERQLIEPKWNPLLASNELADRLSELNIDRFTLHAFSAGVRFALSMAPHLQSRLNSVICISGPAHLDRPAAYHNMFHNNAECFRAAIAGEWELSEYIRRGALRPQLPLSELQCISESPALLDVMIQNHNRLLTLSNTREINDYLVLVQPWSPSQRIQVPVYILHGENDKLTPVHHAEELARNLPGSQLKIFRNTCHFGMWNQQSSITRIIRKVWNDQTA